MKYPLAQIAAFLQAGIEGNPDLTIEGIARIEEGKPGTITFLANPKYLPYIYTTQASVVIVAENFEATQPISATLLRVADPYSAFTRLLEFANSQQQADAPSGVHALAFVDPTAEIAEGASVGPFSFVGKNARIGAGARIYPNVTIGDGAIVGDGTILYPGVVVYAGCEIGQKCILHGGVIIGGDGFGFAPQADGTFQKIPQTGNVIIEDEVEIGANTCIDRATIGSTIIRKGVKLDDLVMVAHNVEIGNHTVIAAQTGVSGSTKIGKQSMIGGQVGIGGHIHIADKSQIGARSAMVKSITEEGKAWRGAPAQEYRKQLRQEAMLRQLEDMAARISHLEEQLQSKQAPGEQP